VSRQRLGDVAFGVAVHAARFAVIVLALWVAPLLGITGWYMGLFANAVCAVFAIALVTYFRLWRTTGFLTASRGRVAILLLLILIAEALIRAFPDGLIDEAPGFGLWGLTLLLVGFNEELISRGVVLERMRTNFSPIWAVTITASLFGLQHLSAFATSDRGALDILTNVLASASYGFALAAFQFRFSWIWPLMLIHAAADFTSILGRAPYGDLFAAVTCVIFVGYGVYVLRAGPGRVRGGSPGRCRRPSIRFEA
jgi:membrane protease YdiL (CAAX protease family)